MPPDWTQSLAYLGLAAAVAGLVALSRTGNKRPKMPEGLGWCAEHEKRIGGHGCPGKRQTRQKATSSY